MRVGRAIRIGRSHLSRQARRTLWAAAALGLACAALPPLAQEAEQEPLAADPAEQTGDAFAEADPLEQQRLAAAIAGLEEQAELNETELARAVRSYREAVIQRNEALEALVATRSRLDREVARPREISADRLDELADELLRAEVRHESLVEQTSHRLADLRRLLRSRDAMARRIATLRARLPAQQELLTGVWEVRWLPAGSVGTFYLDQSGTLITGQYRLGTIGDGSLQGTFVGGKLFLQRIDSQRGRDAELEGFVDPDGARIRGTWQAYELVQGGLPHGHWVARRVR
ncbi:MAG: hypothetical protein JSV80_04455 [Acidobacteriota bacterium]|nr:MAG: hypothetical protein JSV80_04455 [Acidobacteriota bacterium]